jgi:Family of unknown function (DUF6489)
VDFAKGVCQLDGRCGLIATAAAREGCLKIQVEFDCTPDEARRFLGLPDVTQANEAYAEAMAKAMQGVGNVEQLQEYARALAPMGQMGLKLFQQMMESGATMARTPKA